MSSISPGPLSDISGVGDPISVAQFNFEATTRDLYKFTPTYQNGVATTIIGPPTSGAHILGELWKDSLVASWRCTVAGTPGTWRQEHPAVAASLPSAAAYTAGYRIQDGSDLGREYAKVGSAWAKTYASKAEILAELASRGIQGGIYWYDTTAGIATTTALTGILRSAGVSGPTIIAGLTADRLARIGTSGATLSNSVIRDDGSRASIGATPDGAQLAFQVTGGISLIGASTIKTSLGEMTFDTGNSLAINFKIGGSNGWRIRPESILESEGAQTIRTSSGNLTIATGAANGNILLRPHGTGGVCIGAATCDADAILELVSTVKGLLLPRLTTTQKNAMPKKRGMVIYDDTLGKVCQCTGAAWETCTSA